MVPAATPFSKILVANRGEIALRVARTARAMGYRTVAVYSTADADARHVDEADQAVCIGPPPPAQSYLHIPALIGAAQRSGADAVHPGYGFLAENAAFARACRDAGLVFIGPSPEAISAMGDKAGAKALMAAAGVPCIPGYQGGHQSDGQGDERLAAEAARIGFPLMVKATAGGGGRGMRLVPSADAFLTLLHSAQSEARSAFGDATVILERAIVDARHIEIQVFADRHGNAVHLGERDCSVQRRHQKLIEESPSPAVGAELRARMGATAVAAAKAIGYEGAGTLEFLLDGSGEFFFMEMNTRLQVEHPVTETVTGLDLVEWQLRVAAGEPLPLAQDAVHFEGHAIEVRLCAEDAAKDFLPQSGTLALWRMPPQLRVEQALHDGAAIPPHYDSMVAKLVAHGRTRSEARRKLLAGLHDAVALGVVTNQAFLQRCLAHPVFAAGGATTGFIEQNLAQLLATDGDAQARALAVAAVLLCQPAGDSHAQTASAARLANPLPMALRLDVAGVPHHAHVMAGPPGQFNVTLGERRCAIDRLRIDGPHLRVACDGIDDNALWHRDGNTLLLHWRGLQLTVTDTTRAAAPRLGHSAATDGTLRALMNGRVVAVLAAVGDAVRAGQPILTLEAMKMEHLHAAPAAGTLTALHVAAGDQVAAGRIVAEFAP